jgi:ABC-type iron transport system FetAB ATPase subunit
VLNIDFIRLYLVAALLNIKQLITRHVGPLDLDLAAGECLTLTGPSGSGKTLLLRAITDLDPHQGEVFLEDKSYRSMCAHVWRKQVGLLPAESQWWLERIGEHFAKVDEACLAELGFDKTVMDWDVARCSTGERQRLAMARLLQNRPRVLLLDEPTTSLDAKNVARVEALIARLRTEWGLGVIWVSHDEEQVARVGSRHLQFDGQGQLHAEVA